MPTYEYQCKACGQRSEFFQKMSEEPVTKCPHCEANELQRLISAAGFHLKGSGWYVTDFKNPPKNKSTESSKTTTESSSKEKSDNTSTKKTDD